MSQKNSGYNRIPRDAYMTPPWVTRVLANDLDAGDPDRHLLGPHPMTIWEPACGTGLMVGVLKDLGHGVLASDIAPQPGATKHDFLAGAGGLPVWAAHARAIVTNPPYDRADAFVLRALEAMRPVGGAVCMLLKVDFDSGGTRNRMFSDCPAWARKLVLTDRILWIESEDGTGSASENHAWFIWDWGSTQQPTIGYAGMPEAEKRELRARMAARRKAAKKVASSELRMANSELETVRT